MQCVIATSNVHKVRELKRLLGDMPIEMCPASICGGMPDVVEDGATFAENAQIKAEALRQIAPSNTWVLADDSGLEVDALEGAPGIYSARYAGEGARDGENVSKLLAEMKEVQEGKRTACFHCALCLVDMDGNTTYFTGICEGRIAQKCDGDDGFGYDPVFIPEGYDQSFARLGEQVKDVIGHRGRAIQSLKETL